MPTRRKARHAGTNRNLSRYSLFRCASAGSRVVVAAISWLAVFTEFRGNRIFNALSTVILALNGRENDHFKKYLPYFSFGCYSIERNPGGPNEVTWA